MTRRRWIADEVNGNRAILTGQNAVHLARVLRARVGQEFDISHNGCVRLGTIVKVEEERIELELGAEISQADQSKISLMLAVFKFDRMEWAIEKATELGAARIMPVIARRTDAHLASAAAKRVERWRKIAHEAAQQSRRAAEPEIAPALKLKEALDGIAESCVRIVLDETEDSVTLAQVMSAATSGGAVILAIGPEGGWAEEELQLFAQHGWKSATLGPTILRAETAAIAALSVAGAMSAANCARASRD
jgi:16S rRNA (uracil1498-N3)-methyltransferase